MSESGQEHAYSVSDRKYSDTLSLHFPPSLHLMLGLIMFIMILIAGITAETVANAFVTGWVVWFGVPLIIITDQRRTVQIPSLAAVSKIAHN